MLKKLSPSTYAIAILVLIRLVAVGTFLTFSLVAKATPLAATSASLTNTQLGWISKNVDTLPIQYNIAPQDDGSYWVFCDYARATTTDVTAVASSFNREAAKLANSGTPFKATIVFARPLSVTEFTSFVKATGISPTSSELRAVGSKGELLKVGIPPVWEQDSQGNIRVGHPLAGGDPLDTSKLNPQHWRQSFRVIGVISTDVTLDAQTYKKVSSDNKVFTIDVLPQIIINEVKQKYPNVQADRISVGGSLVYPAMEKVNLAPQPH
jgi:hypothetical protein